MENAVYLLSSCSRYIYKNDIYRTLAAPRGYIINFRYRSKWVDDDLWKQSGTGNLVGRKAVPTGVIDRGWGQVDLVPLRRGEIVHTQQDSGVLHIYVAMGEKIDSIDQRRSDIGEWTTAPADFGEDLEEEWTDLDDAPVGAFESDDFMKFDSDNAWSSIVENLSTYSEFEDSLFYRISGVSPINEVTEGTDHLMVEKINNISYGFTLESARNYVLEFVLDFGEQTPEQAEKSTLEIESTGNIDIFPEAINLGFKVDKKRVNINTGTMNYNSVESLRISHSGSVEAASLELPLKLDRYSGENRTN